MRLADRRVVSTIDQLLPLGTGSSPELVVRALCDVPEDERAEQSHAILEERVGLLVGQVEVGLDHAGVQRDGLEGRVPARQLGGEEDVGGFGGAVTGPGTRGRQLLGGHDGVGRRGHVEGFGADADDADVGSARRGRLFQQREEKLGQLEVADVVGAELDVVAGL